MPSLFTTTWIDAASINNLSNTTIHQGFRPHRPFLFRVFSVSVAASTTKGEGKATATSSGTSTNAEDSSAGSLVAGGLGAVVPLVLAAMLHTSLSNKCESGVGKRVSIEKPSKNPRNGTDTKGAENKSKQQ
ncbi:hypothetical protein QBC45DRAFT_457947 [Copromyces sp. CBS 386.78]|nr:hypothetical protein QBC45DRAFT_457947 [Copromyces sp. CBS 386.78]